MAYVRVALDTIQPGKTAELLTRIREGLLPLLRQQPGFVAYDVITTGGSTLQAIEAVEEAGGKVAFVLALVDREEGGRRAIEERGHKVVAVFTRTDLIGAKAGPRSRIAAV